MSWGPPSSAVKMEGKEEGDEEETRLVTKVFWKMMWPCMRSQGWTYEQIVDYDFSALRFCRS